MIVRSLTSKSSLFDRRLARLVELGLAAESVTDRVYVIWICRQSMQLFDGSRVVNQVDHQESGNYVKVRHHII